MRFIFGRDKYDDLDKYIFGDELGEGEDEGYQPLFPWEDNSKSAPAGAPAERTDAPVPEKLAFRPRWASAYSLDRRFAPRPDAWSEPSYSETHETTSDMYTPGIYANHPHVRSRFDDAATLRTPRERKGRAGKFMRAACLILVCAMLSGAAAYGVMEFRFNRGDFTVVNQVVLGGSAESQQSGSLSTPMYTARSGMSAEDLYDMACTQVVSITTKAEPTGGGVFGGMVPGTVAPVSGSGFIISSDGYILTNFHVVEMSYEYNLPLIVSLMNGSEYDAQIIGYEKNNDVALIKIEALGLNPATIANSDNIRVGQSVYAVGNPLGELVYTMTDGIVSARDREVSVEGKIINTFQFSAAVNSGNSGGPLYDSNGEVIGIVTAKPMRTSVEGIGFAIPINDAIEIAAELIEHGYITGRPLMGITAQTVSGAHAEYWGWVVGARVMSVTEGSAAEKAGIMVSDIITVLGGSEIDSVDTLIFTLRRYRAGETASFTVWRDGEVIEQTITFDEDLSAGQAKAP